MMPVTTASFAASQVGTPGAANMAPLATGARFRFRAALPFVAGAALGKQFVIWPVGFGLMQLADRVHWVFDTPKRVSAGCIFWLAWKVANMRQFEINDGAQVPVFMSGLAVRPLNPKAWAIVVTGFTSFVTPDTPMLQVTATIAAILLISQMVSHPVWAFAGDRIASTVAGTPGEAYLIWTLAVLTVLSVLFVLFGGGTST